VERPLLGCAMRRIRRRRKRRWIVLFHYECEGLNLADALGTFCPECLQIHREEHNRITAASPIALRL
jgi:hypothetical protein